MRARPANPFRKRGMTEALDSTLSYDTDASCREDRSALRDLDCLRGCPLCKRIERGSLRRSTSDRR